MAAETDSATAPETHPEPEDDTTPIDKHDFAGLRHQWLISKARRNLEIAEAGLCNDDDGWAGLMDKANDAHEERAREIFEEIAAAEAKDMTVQDAGAVLWLALDVVADENGEHWDDALPLMHKANRALAWQKQPERRQKAVQS